MPGKRIGNNGGSSGSMASNSIGGSSSNGTRGTSHNSTGGSTGGSSITDMAHGSVSSSGNGNSSPPPREQGFILHMRPFQERGQILDLVTAPSGRVSVLARRSSPGLRPFTLLDLNWRGRGQLPSLTLAEDRHHFPLRGRALVCGMYLNELVLRLLPRDLHVASVVPILATAYADLDTPATLEGALRRAEWELLSLLDSGLEHLAHQVLEPEAGYFYHPEQGLEGPVTPTTTGCLPGAALQALARGQVLQDNLRRPARDFMRRLIDRHLDGRELHTRRLI